jgi:integrase
MMQPVRGHNEGSVYFRSADRHKVAQVTMPDGRRPTLACPHRHRPSDRDCPEAKANLVELLRLRDHRAPAGGHTLTLGAYLTGWLRDVRPNLAPETWRKHESICRVHLIPQLGARRLSDLRVSDCRAYLSGMAGLDPQTLRHHRATLRRALADAQRDGLVTRNVAALAEAPKLTRRERRVLTGPQVRALIDGTRDDRLHALWVVLATTGLREAEALALTWEDVELGELDEAQTARRPQATVELRSDLGNKATAPGSRPVGWPVEAGTSSPPQLTVRSTLHRIDGEWKFRDPKTDKSRRTIPLPPVTVAALREHRRRQLEEQAAQGVMGKSGLVFTTERGQPIHGTNLSKALYAHLDRLALPRVTVHDLRHSAATVLYAMGVPLPVISDMLGHSTIRVTSDLYRHRVADLARDAAERMQEAVG